MDSDLPDCGSKNVVADRHCIGIHGGFGRELMAELEWNMLPEEAYMTGVDDFNFFHYDSECKQTNIVFFALL